MSATFENLDRPSAGAPIRMTDTGLQVPDRPIIPFIEGDGTGPDIWAAGVRVFDAAVSKAYGDKRKLEWFEVFAGQKSYDKYGTWLPNDTLTAIREARARKEPMS
jgi:isocitrate dehydrogenase